MNAAVPKELIERIALHDDHLAYKQLFGLYYSKLVQFSYSILHSKESAEEVVSDVFLKIWNMRHSLLTINNLHLYLYISCKNLSINQLKKLKREQVFSIDETIVELKSIHFNPEQMMMTAEVFHRIQSAVQQLPPRCRLIFKLVKEDGLSYKEVAELLHLSVKTIENQMTIALRKLGNAILFKPFEVISN